MPVGRTEDGCVLAASNSWELLWCQSKECSNLLSHRAATWKTTLTLWSYSQQHQLISACNYNTALIWRVVMGKQLLLLCNCRDSQQVSVFYFWQSKEDVSWKLLLLLQHWPNDLLIYSFCKMLLMASSLEKRLSGHSLDQCGCIFSAGSLWRNGHSPSLEIQAEFILLMNNLEMTIRYHWWEENAEVHTVIFRVVSIKLTCNWHCT